jgi:hypothetical protein
MSHLKELFKLSEITSILTQYCQEIVGNPSPVNFDSYSVVRLPEELGYLGQHFTLKIRFSGGEVSFFLKVAAEDQEKYLQEIGVFSKEIGLYRRVLAGLPGNFP